MSRRRRRGLGDAAETHRSKSRASLSQVERSINSTAKAVAKGNCKVAFDHFAFAAQSFGDAITHHLSTGGSVSDLGTRLNNMYHDVREDFVRACVRSAPGVAGVARRRRKRS